MLENYKIQIKKRVLKIYTLNYIGKDDLLMSIELRNLKCIDFPKEVRSQIESALVEYHVKEKLKAQRKNKRVDSESDDKENGENSDLWDYLK